MCQERGLEGILFEGDTFTQNDALGLQTDIDDGGATKIEHNGQDSREHSYRFWNAIGLTANLSGNGQGQRCSSFPLMITTLLAMRVISKEFDFLKNDARFYNLCR